MDRTRYLLAYDIREDRRLRETHRCALGYGHALQYSVFICDLAPRELISMRVDLRAIIDHRADSIVIVDLGPATDRGRFCFEFMGVHRQLPSPGGPTIV